MADFTTPPFRVLIALGSIIIHYEEFLETGESLDKTVIDSLRNQPEVKEWFDEMNKATFLPLKRDKENR